MSGLLLNPKCLRLFFSSLYVSKVLEDPITPELYYLIKNLSESQEHMHLLYEAFILMFNIVSNIPFCVPDNKAWSHRLSPTSRCSLLFSFSNNKVKKKLKYVLYQYMEIFVRKQRRHITLGKKNISLFIQL